MLKLTWFVNSLPAYLIKKSNKKLFFDDCLIRIDIYYKVFLEIDEKVLDYSNKHIKDRFSYLEVSLASGNTTIANYMGLESFKSLNLDQDIIPAKYVDNLKDVTQWIFGRDENGTGSLINDSRLINSFLKPILANPDATEHLKTYEDMDGAWELTNGEEQLVIGNLKNASKLVNTILGKVNKHKDYSDFQNSLEALKGSIESVEKLIK